MRISTQIIVKNTSSSKDNRIFLCICVDPSIHSLRTCQVCRHENHIGLQGFWDRLRKKREEDIIRKYKYTSWNEVSSNIFWRKYTINIVVYSRGSWGRIFFLFFLEDIVFLIELRKKRCRKEHGSHFMNREKVSLCNLQNHLYRVRSYDLDSCYHTDNRSNIAHIESLWRRDIESCYDAFYHIFPERNLDEIPRSDISSPIFTDKVDIGTSTQAMTKRDDSNIHRNQYREKSEN